MTATESGEQVQGRNDPPAWVMVPMPGAVVAVAAVALMVTVSVAAWPEMAAEIVTREADGRHGESVAGRGVTAAAMPVALLVIVAVLSVVVRLDHELLGRTLIGQERSPERARRVFSWALMGLSVVLTLLHIGLVAMHTGDAYPLEQAVGVGGGILLACLGIAAPLFAPGGRLEGRAERFRAAQGAAYRTAGIFLVVAGVATAVAAIFDGAASMYIASGSVLLAFGWVGVTAIRGSMGRRPAGE